MKHSTAIEYLKQGWLEGELTLTQSTVGEFIERVGAHIYQDYENGLLTWDEVNASLESLNMCEEIEA